MLSPIQIRPNAETQASARTFAADGVVQVTDFLADASATAVAELLGRLPYIIVTADEQGQTLAVNDEAVRRFGEAQIRKLLGDSVARSARGFGFLHQSYALQDEYARAPNDPARPVTEFLQSRAFLDVGGAIIGREVTGVRVQASRYRKGDFLTLHDDTHRTDVRLAAFTLGFTKGWRPD